MPASPEKPFRAACIDIGSNGIRCVAADYDGSATPRVVFQGRASVRLGASVFTDGAIDVARMDAAIVALKDFRAQLGKLEPLRLRVVATSAVREARNRKTFRKRAKAEAGLDVEIISGSEEARLVHLAVAQRIVMDKPWLLVDVGGGSVEVSLATAEGLQWTESHSVGAVRLLEHFHDMQDKPRKVQRLVEETVEALRLPNLDSTRVAGLVATGGNIEELAGIVGKVAPGSGLAEILVKDLQVLLKEMQALSPDQRGKEWGLKPDRADVIVPAGLVYAHVAALAGVPAIQVPHVALKDGVLAELMQEATEPSPASESKAVRSALAVGRHFRFEESHAVQVERLALSLFDQLEPVHELGPRDRVILAAAAILHDIGRHVSDHKHHKHSYYLIRQADVAGVTQAELGLTALVARYHRKAEPKLKHEAYAALAVPDRQRVEKLAGILRIADALDRQHKSRVQAVRAKADRATLQLDLAVEGDIELEEWAVARKGGLFERVFGLKVELGHHELPAIPRPAHG